MTAAFWAPVPWLLGPKQGIVGWLALSLLLSAIGSLTADAEPPAPQPMPVDPTPEPYAAIVAEASQRFGLPSAWIRDIMCAESFGEPHALSSTGAMGLMQIRPDTWAGLRLRYGLGSDPYDIHDNIIAGAAYLRDLYDRYGSADFIAAYNGAPATIRPTRVDTATAPFAAPVTAAARRFGFPEMWIRAVISEESGGEPRALSPKGAMGLMQIMPDTWTYLRGRYGLGDDPYDVHDNITAGVGYLRELYDRYGAAGFLAAYSAGPARWEDHAATGRPLPAETRDYLAHFAPMIDCSAIVATILQFRAEEPAPAPPSAGPSHKDPPDGPAAPAPETASPFFARLRVAW